MGYNPYTLGTLHPLGHRIPLIDLAALLRHGPSTHHLANIKSLQQCPVKRTDFLQNFRFKFFHEICIFLTLLPEEGHLK